ncbi:hypothetical protein LIER_39131 [Lithospermum erythrorhizon]|uniref:Uncharacterized protein n=1 Tax=Lithospermum erythrorhizon TaxID=34254 RepID=A0AAV3QA22_LITER
MAIITEENEHNHNNPQGNDGLNPDDLHGQPQNEARRMSQNQSTYELVESSCDAATPGVDPIVKEGKAVEASSDREEVEETYTHTPLVRGNHEPAAGQ